MAQVCYVGLFCLLVSVYVQGQSKQECLGDFEAVPDHGVEKAFMDNSAGPLLNVSDSAACLEACCSKDDCQMALMGTPQDGSAQCFLVSCAKDGKDMCSLRPLMGFTVYRRSQTSPRASNADPTDRCRAPMVVGSCRAAFPRFYYDASNQTCKPFIYGGCESNGNNFETEEECKAACDGVTGAVMSNAVPLGRAAKRMALTVAASSEQPAPLPTMMSDDFAAQCQVEPLAGPCRASMQRFFYNSTSRTCQKFTYGGCRGNKNNYESGELCQTTCTVTVIPSPRKPNDDKEHCTAAYDAGPCRAAFPSFYFDPATQSCLPFTYGGCQGNKNRYGSVEECMAECSGTGQVGEHGKHHMSHWTPAFFLVATLAIMSILLLVALLLVSVRKVRSHRRHRDDKEELLPEDQLATEEQRA